MAAALAVIAAPAAVSATTLPPAVYSQLASNAALIGSYNPTKSDYHADGAASLVDGASASVSTNPFPAVSAVAQSGIFQYYYGGSLFVPPNLDEVARTAESRLSYSFSVSGPTPQLVPLTAAFKISAGVEGTVTPRAPSYATAAGQISGDIASFTGPTNISVDTEYPRGPFDPDIHFSMLTDAIGTAALSTRAVSIVTMEDEASKATAYADPYITIDPDWLAANPGYSLSFSTGIGNAAPDQTAAVPEPASWAMMIAGFGLIGGTMRHRKVRVSYA